MSIGYGTPKTALPAVGDAQPAAMQLLLDDVSEVQQTLEQKVTEAGVDFSAVGDVPHGLREFTIGPARLVLVSGTGTAPATVGVNYWLNGNSLGLRADLDLLAGDRLQSVVARVRPNGVGQQWTVRVLLITPYGSQSILGSATSTTGTSDEDVPVTFTAITLAAGEYISVTLSTASAVATPRVYGVDIGSDRP